MNMRRSNDGQTSLQYGAAPSVGGRCHIATQRHAGCKQGFSRKRFIKAAQLSGLTIENEEDPQQR
jgi:hypothetical protein